MAEVDEFSTAAFISSRRVRFIYTYAYYLHCVEMNNFLTNYYFTFGTSVFRTYASIAERINRIQAYIMYVQWGARSHKHNFSELFVYFSFFQNNSYSTPEAQVPTKDGTGECEHSPLR